MKFKEISIFFLCFVLNTTLSYGYTHDCQQDFGKLHLKNAIQLAISHNPLIKAALQQSEATQGAFIQAGLLPNPELSVGFDDFGGTGDYKGTSSVKSTIGISQQLLTAGKRSKRVKTATIKRELAHTEIDKAVMELKLAVYSNFLKVYSLEKQSEIQEESVQLASEVASIVEKRVQAGETPAIDATRAQVDLSSERVKQKRLLRDLKSSQRELVSFWNSECFHFDGVELDESMLGTLASIEVDKVDLLKNPEYRSDKKKIELQSQMINLVKAESSPDIGFSISVSKTRESGDRSLGVEFSVPLTLFDRGQGNKKEASAQLSEAKSNFQSTEIALRTKLSTLYEEIQSLREELENAKKALLPAAHRAYNETKRAYDEGERELISLLDARKSLLEASKTLLELQDEFFKVIGDYAIITSDDQQLFDIQLTDITEKEVITNEK